MYSLYSNNRSETFSRHSYTNILANHVWQWRLVLEEVVNFWNIVSILRDTRSWSFQMERSCTVRDIHACLTTWQVPTLLDNACTQHTIPHSPHDTLLTFMCTQAQVLWCLARLDRSGASSVTMDADIGLLFFLPPEPSVSETFRFLRFID